MSRALYWRYKAPKQRRFSETLGQILVSSWKGAAEDGACGPIQNRLHELRGNQGKPLCTPAVNRVLRVLCIIRVTTQSVQIDR